LLAENKRRIRRTQATGESRLEEAWKEWEHQHGAVARESFPVTGIMATYRNLWSSVSDVFLFLPSFRFVTHTLLCQQCTDETLQGL